MRALFRNTEIKRFTIGFIVLQAIIIAVFLMIFSIKANELKRIYINHNIAVAGKILEVNPELEKDIVGYFTKGVDKRDIETGTKILSKYGYTDKAELIQDSLVYSIFSKTGLQFCLYIVLFAGIVYLFSIIEFKNVFNRINTMSSAADEIIKGNYNVEISDFCEGDMYILGHQLNEITKIIKNNIDVLKKEKTFLKNIISDISHQLKTPLSSLIMFNELLLDDVIETEVDKKAIIVQSHDQLNRMEWLIVNLLKLARIESGTIEFNMNNSPVSTTIEKALAPLKLKAEEKNQKISIICNTNILLRHDCDWTVEAITNLVKNSIEHTPMGGTISIEVQETPLCISIDVKDAGEGIKKEDIPRVFERFYKGSNSPNPNSIGIGLALCKAIVEGQGGSIGVDSRENEGARFNIVFLKCTI